MIHIFVGPEAEKLGIIYAALHGYKIKRVSDGVRTAAAVLNLTSTRPISEALNKLFPKLYVRVDKNDVICDVPDEAMLSRLCTTMHEIHGDKATFEDVKLHNQYMELPPTPEGQQKMDRVGIATRALVQELGTGIIVGAVKPQQLRDLLEPLQLLGAKPDQLV